MKQYIVEHRKALKGEQALAAIQRGGALTPYTIKWPDGHSTAGRPVIVGEIDPEAGTIIYYADQDNS